MPLPRVHLITGYALDRRVLEYLHLPVDRFHCADLIPVEGNESLEQYALRLSRTLGFQSGDIVGGVSLGGMLALEIARQCGASKVLLVASCTHPRFIRFPFRVLGKMAFHIPEPIFRVVFRNVPTVLRMLGMHTAQGEAMLREIMGNFPTSLLRHLPRMIFAWKGCEPAIPYAALHSQDDWLIRPPLHLAHLTVVPGKNHLLPISQMERTRNFLLDHC